MSRLPRAAAAAALILLAGAALAQTPLSGDEVRKLIVGAAVSGPIGARPYEFDYSADGTVVGTIGADTDNGSWRIRDDGAYCHSWPEFFDGVERCYRWHAQDGGRYLMKNVDSYRVPDVPVWRIVPGGG